jgi:membrane protein required for colicin V production
MSWIDLLIVLIITISTLISFIRGFLKEVIALLAWVAGIWVAVRYAAVFAEQLPQALERAHLNVGEVNFVLENLRVGVAFVILLVLVLIAGAIINRIIGYLVTRGRLNLANRLMGMLFGVARGSIIIIALVIVAGFTELPRTPWWGNAQLVEPFQHGAQWLLAHLPPKFATGISFAK